ncbi:MAG: phosphoribosylamine--glycine ligase [Pyrinomonadaceae bacterium]
MQILVVGSGGREHAICAAFERSERVKRIFCANGNAGIAEIAECVPINPTEIGRLADFAERNSINMTFIGGEASLALGIADEFQKRGLAVIGPSAAATRLESSKIFAKDFMTRHRVPTAKYANSMSPAAAIAILNNGQFGGPNASVVVKADGLAAGKGVIVAADLAEAIAAINEMVSLVGSEAASQIVLEECLVGHEVSLLMFADGEDFALMPPTRDHKRIGEGDTGPNTGGMGTFTDSSLLSESQLEEIVERIVRPTLRGCISEGYRFRGILFLGLMMIERASGGEAAPMLLEYNVRFGDPETQSILVRLDSDLGDVCDAMVEGRLANEAIEWKPGNSACVVLAAKGYPSNPRTGDVISGVEDARASPDVRIFHSGTARNANGDLITAGGRVLGVTAIGDDLNSTLRAAYNGVSKIAWNGMQFRRDIGGQIR